MSDNTRIDWAQATINPIGWGCYGPDGTAEQPKRCPYCYAARQARRRLRHCPDCQKFVPHEHPEELDKPAHWRKQRRIFVESMGDLFGEGVAEGYLHEIFSRLQDNWHIKIILTKQARRMCEILKRLERNHELFYQVCRDDRFWFLTSITDQADASERIPWLLETPAAVKGMSIEPLLGPIDFQRIKVPTTEWSIRSQWIVVGAMTGPGSRKQAPKREWIGNIRQQCLGIGVPLFEKRSLARYVDRPLVQQFPG